MEGFGSPSSTSNDGEGDDNNDSGHITSVLHEKMMGYMPSSFAGLVFAGERIEVGLRRGKFDYAASTSTCNRRTRMGGAKKKEGDAHAVTAAPTWLKAQQTRHNPTYQYSPPQYNYSANIGPPPSLTPIQQRMPTQPQRSPP